MTAFFHLSGNFPSSRDVLKTWHSDPASEAAQCFNRRLHTPLIPGAFHEFNEASFFRISRGSIILNEKQHSHRGVQCGSSAGDGALHCSEKEELRHSAFSTGDVEILLSSEINDGMPHYALVHMPFLSLTTTCVVDLATDLGKDWTVCSGSSHAPLIAAHRHILPWPKKEPSPRFAARRTLFHV